MGKSAERDAKSRDGGTLPLVVCDETGKFLNLAAMNRKGFTKSLEQGILWTIHPATERLLPEKESRRILVLKDKKTHYYAEIKASETEKAESAPAKKTGKGSKMETTEKTKRPAGDATVLPRLAEIVKQRKKELPEGSYTTHLFKAGPDKIRKKTGEEAVELILARKPDEIVYEAADLVYHLLVLLEVEGIGLDRVFEELERRSK